MNLRHILVIIKLIVNLIFTVTACKSCVDFSVVLGEVVNPAIKSRFEKTVWI